MRRSDAEFHLRDVRQMSDRVMIDLFKRKINDMNRSPRHLQGTWHEAGDFLITHFGKISRIMDENKKTLLKLYQAAIKEVEQSSV
ncbi:MAG: hypothetical protein WBG51_02755 [Syntrophobacteria bacterium]